MIGNESLNVQDAARYLGVGKNKVYDMVKTGELSSYRIGRKIQFRVDDLQAFLDKRHAGADPDGLSHIELLNEAVDPFKGQVGYTLAGLGLAADAIVDELEQMGTAARRVRRTSYAGIVDLYVGNADGAIVHLYDQKSNSYNIPYVQRLAPGLPLVMIRLVGRQVGFAVAPGNPKRVSSWGALLKEDVRIANRVQGSGARVLLDEKLLAMEADPYVIPGYDSIFDSALGATEAVAAGLADVALVDRKLAEGIPGVGFVPLQEEWLDIVLAKRGNGRQLIRLVKRMLSDERFKQTYATLTDGNMSRFGSIVYES